MSFPFANLQQHVEKFGFIVGVQRRAFRDQDFANIKAVGLIGKLHDALEAMRYPDRDLMSPNFCKAP